MYSVSDVYLEALKSKTRSDSISGSVTLADGQTIEVDDSNIVRNSVKISRELCGSSYRIGTFCLACLQISFFDPSGAVRDYSGARITLTYKLISGGGQTVPLGHFIADGSLTRRKKSIVTLTAYDNGVKFDEVPSDMIRSMTAEPFSFIGATCSQCGVRLATPREKIYAMPNSGVTVSASSAQIQSCRDLIMWCADLLCAYAVIDRNGALDIIPAKYSVGEEDASEIAVTRQITEHERKSICVSDTRAYIKYLTGYSGGKVKNYVSARVDPDTQAFSAAYEMRSNPLLSGKSEAECDSINETWLSYIDGFKQRSITAELYGDPAIDPGDVIRFSGGDIDQRGSVVGLVTGIEWRYRGYTALTCSAAPCGGYSPTDGGQSGQTARARSSVKTQSEKRMDALGVSSDGADSGGVGEDLGNGNERFNDYENNTVSGTNYNNHIQGIDNTVKNYSRNSFAGGRLNTLDRATECVVSGFWNEANGAADGLVYGQSNYLTGGRNMVGGLGNRVLSGKNQSIATGEFNRVASKNSIYFGEYNDHEAENAEDLRLVLGGGTQDERKNIAWIDKNGRAYFAGGINYKPGCKLITRYTVGNTSVSEHYKTVPYDNKYNGFMVYTSAIGEGTKSGYTPFVFPVPDDVREESGVSEAFNSVYFKGAVSDGVMYSTDYKLYVHFYLNPEETGLIIQTRYERTDQLDRSEIELLIYGYY